MHVTHEKSSVSVLNANKGPLLTSNANSCVKRHQCVTYCRLFTLDVTYPQDESWCLSHLNVMFKLHKFNT